MDSFSIAWTLFDLTICLKKAAVTYRPALENAYSETSIYVYGQKVQFVAKFVYLGSSVNMPNTMDD